MKINLHTHTYRCKHASGTVNDYCQAAVDADIIVLGISDHTPLPDDRWPWPRMLIAEFPDHLHDMKTAKEKFLDLILLSAMECEWAPEYKNWYQDVLLGTHAMDYLVGAAHFLPSFADKTNLTDLDTWTGMCNKTLNAHDLICYSNYLSATIESGLFAFIAHPDMFMTAYGSFDANAQACARDIFAAAAENKVPLELNAYGLRKPPVESDEGPRPGYPYRGFWELAQEYDITYLINSDAHLPNDVWGNRDETVAFIDGLDLRQADMSYLWKDLL